MNEYLPLLDTTADIYARACWGVVKLTISYMDI